MPARRRSCSVSSSSISFSPGLGRGASTGAWAGRRPAPPRKGSALLGGRPRDRGRVAGGKALRQRLVEQFLAMLPARLVVRSLRRCGLVVVHERLLSLARRFLLRFRRALITIETCRASRHARAPACRGAYIAGPASRR